MLESPFLDSIIQHDLSSPPSCLVKPSSRLFERSHQHCPFLYQGFDTGVQLMSHMNRTSKHPNKEALAFANASETTSRLSVLTTCYKLICILNSVFGVKF